jgi:hypothetical protein
VLEVLTDVLEVLTDVLDREGADRSATDVIRESGDVDLFPCRSLP